MNKGSLRFRLTLLIGCILIVINALLTVISIYNVDNKFVQPNVAGKMLNYETVEEHQPFNKEIMNNELTVSVEVKEAQKQFTIQSILWMIAIIVVGIGATYVLVGRALKPVRELSKSVKSISEHNLSQRIEKINSNDEIGDLALAFNNMLDRLEKSFLYRRSFAANAAHELKTPLTIIKSGIQVLKLDPSPTLVDYKEIVDVTEQSTQRLIQVVDDLLALASEESEEFYCNIKLNNLFDEIINELQPLCMEKEIKINFAPCNGVVRGNQTLLYRVFFNLIENAVKYNEASGTVTVRTNVHNDVCTISITDTGMGIPKEVIPYIFEPFYRVDMSRTRQLGGSGLGLSIVKTIVEKHKGTINVNSIVNVGTTFEVNLPIQ